VNSLDRRRIEDVDRLRSLCSSSGGKLRFTSVLGAPPSSAILELLASTAPSDRYPSERQTRTSITIYLADRYPFERPRVRVSPVVFHPNVYGNGDVCMGSRWIPTEGLDVTVKRIVQILVFDPAVTNTASAANSAAGSWYSEAIRRYPADFPTDRVSFGSDEASQRPTFRWHDVSPGPIEFECRGCHAPLRVTAGATGRARCPRCAAITQVQA
jgi:LSD1 subclass zinc finger protein